EEPPDEGGDLETLGEGTYKSLSFRDVVQNIGSMNNTMDDEWEVDDFVLREDNVRKGIVDRVHSIEFSNRVYGLIEESMSKTLVIKLLGRKIRYNNLFHKVCALWKLSHPKIRPKSFRGILGILAYMSSEFRKVDTR
ncbi:hypothetical protein Gogos_006181, partial [Gossypium gossypioides]|nr:hypothetical protein [Gossypium gossypioides]